MSKIKVVVEYIAGNADSNISGTTLPEGNNTSTGNILNPAPNLKPFVFGASKLGEGQKFASRYNGYASRQVADESGNLNPPLRITVKGDYIETLRFKFAESLNQWATEIDFNGVVYQNDNLVFTVGNLPLLPNQEYNLIIRKWSAPKFNIRVDNVTLDYVVEYDTKQLEEIVAGNDNAPDESVPRFGLLGQYGDIRLKDIKSGGDYEIKALAEKGLLAPKSPITMYIYGGKFAEFRSQKWSWEMSKISAPLEDELVDLREEVAGTEVGYVSSRTALSLLYETATGLELDISEGAQHMLVNTNIPYAYLENAETWANIQKICDACLLRCWKDNGLILIAEFI